MCVCITKGTNFSGFFYLAVEMVQNWQVCVCVIVWVCEHMICVFIVSQLKKIQRKREGRRERNREKDREKYRKREK